MAHNLGLLISGKIRAVPSGRTPSISHRWDRERVAWVAHRGRPYDFLCDWL